jgi:hypothetical protein
MMDRFRRPFEADFAIVCDADILFMRAIPELLAKVAATGGVAGCMAHVSPFIPPFAELPPGGHADWWARLFAAYGMPPPALIHPHPGYGVLFDDPSARYSPAYFNSGVLVGAGEAMNALAPHAIPATEAVRSVHDMIFCDQLAFTLMLYKTGVPATVAPLRYNFPNHPLIEQALPGELAEVAIIHYLRHEIVDRAKVFASPEALARLIARTDLSGANERLRARLAELHPGLTPEAAGRAGEAAAAPAP